MEERIIEIISEITKIDTKELEEKKTETGIWNSMNHIEIIFALEEEYDIMFEQEELPLLTTLGKIVDSVTRKVE